MTSAPGVAAELFRHVLGHLPTGACIITTTDADGAPLGLSCNSFTSVSLSPPLVSFCPARSSTTWPLMRPAGRFAVNLLAEDQAELCLRFARRDLDRFAGVAWRASDAGNPLLEDCLAWLDCETVAEHEAGDHTIIVAAVRELETCGGSGPLVVFRGGYTQLRFSG